jgi:hypothetical protein
MTANQLLQALQIALQQRGISSFISATNQPGLNVVEDDRIVRVEVGASDEPVIYVWRDEENNLYQESPLATLRRLSKWARAATASAENPS